MRKSAQADFVPLLPANSFAELPPAHRTLDSANQKGRGPDNPTPGPRSLTYLPDMAARGWTLNNPVAAGIVQQTHCGATLGTAVVGRFQAGPISRAGQLPGDAAP